MLKGLTIVLLALWLITIFVSQNFTHLVYGAGALALVLVLAEWFGDPR
jgi:formate/nitrite transporter FocA (FNT family)